MARDRITKRGVDALKAGDTLWDTDVAGFGVRCQRGARVYLIKYRAHGRQRWYTIGAHGSPWTPELARREAKRLLGLLAAGQDPGETRDTGKNRPTVAELCQRYLEEYAAEHKKASSASEDARNIRNHILPLLGRRHVADLTRGHLDGFRRDVAAGKTAKDERGEGRARMVVSGGRIVANRCLALLSKALGLAERWGWRPPGSNPCHGIEKYKEHKRERFLSADELARLGAVLADAEAKGTAPPQAIACVRLLLFTGARLGEILTLQWAYVDFDRACLRLPDSKTGAKVVHLNAPAMELLAGLPRLEGNPHVIFGEREGRPFGGIQKAWQRLRARAGLEDLRLHDLRHSFASVGAADGLSLPIIGALLGHTQAGTTQRYAHLAADPLRQATERVGQRIAEAMNAGQARDNAGEVVALKPPARTA